MITFNIENRPSVVCDSFIGVLWVRNELHRDDEAVDDTR
jgi:hypothetical protein